MFKNIQKYLLVNNPLLWNLKIVPLAIIAFVFHILFFIYGYTSGSIDFNETDNDYAYNIESEIVVFFSVLISILMAIIWIVFYFKNNAYKSFYPLKKFSLFKEWGLLFLGGLLLSSFVVSFFYAKDLRVRNYFSEEEAMQRCEILTIGSFFTSGSGYDFSEYKTIDSAGTPVNVRIDSFLYRSRKFHVNSLINKSTKGFSFKTEREDSLLKVRIKDWLVHNQKDSVRIALQRYLKIAEEHSQKANITAEEWTNLVYDYPDFMHYKEIAEEERAYYNPNDYQYEDVRTEIDTANEYLRIIGKDQYRYYKHYVPANELRHSYSKIARSWVDPKADVEMLLIVFYYAMAFSIIVFSFRVTSGKNWLIALVSFGVINMIFGIFSALFSTGTLYAVMGTLAVIALIIYFFSIVASGKGKSISGIVLNILLWTLPAILPLFYFTSIEIAKQLCGYYSESDYVYRDLHYPTIALLDNSYEIVLQINVAFIIVSMLFLSTVIKKWKGIAES